MGMSRKRISMMVLYFMSDLVKAVCTCSMISSTICSGLKWQRYLTIRFTDFSLVSLRYTIF